MLRGAVLRSEDEAWRYTTAAYSALRHLARANPDIRMGLAEVESWFRHTRTGAKPRTHVAVTAPHANGVPNGTTAASGPAGG
jgi:hypothetical protein